MKLTLFQMRRLNNKDDERKQPMNDSMMHDHSAKTHNQLQWLAKKLHCQKPAVMFRNEAEKFILGFYYIKQPTVNLCLWQN